ncbi:MAG: poly-gamma-glutamate biosynthesis protein PgsC/CapC [Desulfurococcales archaeon]|nr:poly-gamma-glutamate biosynthesis protein PgsC/CapC [Desulfurococcales archaeon]MEB3788336.1 poly-gamma-glutamate biosynthesis protein PgsC/CapC [Desulfurococcales archaeon]
MYLYLGVFKGDILTALILIIGFLIGFIVYSKFKVQIGGVIATPLLVLYVLNYPKSIIVFIIAVVMTYLVLEVLVETTLMYGRRLYYIGAIVSIITTYILMKYISIVQPAYFSIIPAIIGYNVYRESESVENLARSILIWLLEFLSILAIALVIISFEG